MPNVKKLTAGGGGGDMEIRITRLEKDVSDMKVDIASIKAQIPHLATKEDLRSNKVEIQSVRTEIHAVKASLIQWMVGTMLASAGLAATIAFGLTRLIK